MNEMERDVDLEISVSTNTPTEEIYHMIIRRMGLGGQHVRLAWQTSLRRRSLHDLDSVDDMARGLEHLDSANASARKNQPYLKITNKVWPHSTCTRFSVKNTDIQYLPQ